MTKKISSSSSRSSRKNRFRSGGFEYQSLEQRLTLDGSVSLFGSTLVLDQFTENTGVTVTAGGDIVATLADGEVWTGDIMNPNVTLNMEGNQITVAGPITTLQFDSRMNTDLTFNVGAGETLDEIDFLTLGGDIEFNVRSFSFDTSVATISAAGNFNQDGGGPTSVQFGTLSVDIGGNATFDGLGTTSFGGRVGGNFVGESNGVLVVDQLGRSFDGDLVADGFFVGGDADLDIGLGSLTQSASIIVRGDLEISTTSDGSNAISLGAFDNNDFNTINLVNPSISNPIEFVIADRNGLTIEDAEAGDIFIGVGRMGAGQITATGDLLANTVVLQASNGLNQTTGGSVSANRLVVGGEEASEGGGDYIFRGSVDGISLSPGDLVEVDIAVNVRGNLDLATTSELNFIETDVVFADGRQTQVYDRSIVEGNARLFANTIDLSVNLETNNLVLVVQSDATQTADSAIIADQLYLTGTRVNFNSELNDVNQIAARATGDESFLRFFDVGTVRLISLDGTIEGASAARGGLPVVAGLSTERLPQIGIGAESFVDIRTGFGGPVLNPRAGLPPIELDDIERFTIERDASILSFDTDEFGTDRDVFFIEFIHDGVSPFEIVAQGFGFDAELALFDEVGNLLFTADDPVLNLNANINGDDFATPLPAGRYYLASAAFNATFADNFVVQTQFTPATQPTGRLLVTLEIGDASQVLTDGIVTIDSTLNTGSTQQLRNFGFVLDTASDIAVFTGSGNRPGGESAFDTQLFVFELNSDGTLGATVGTDDDSGGGLDSFINLSLSAGQYVAVAGEFELTEAEARAGVSDAGQGGPFQISFTGVDGAVELPAGNLDPGLTVSLINQPLIQPVVDTFLVPTALTPAGNQTTFDLGLLADPGSVIIGGTATIEGTLELGASPRFAQFGFRVAEERLVTIFTGNEITTAADSDFDTEVLVFELNGDGTLGALLATDDNSGNGSDSLVSLTLPTGNYVAVIGEAFLGEAAARSGPASGVVGAGGDFQVTFEGINRLAASFPVSFQDRLESFIAPEVRRSVFQDANAPIDTENLIISAAEDGFILIDNPLNQIDSIRVIETDDFTFDSATGIVINELNANGDVLLTAVDGVTARNFVAQGDVAISAGTNIIGVNLEATGDFDFDAVGDVFLSEIDAGGDIDVNAGDALLLRQLTAAGDVNAIGGEDILVDGITSASNVSLEADDDIRFTSANGIRRLTADNLTLVANNNTNDFGGILLFTDVNSVSAVVASGAGQIFLNEASDINVGILAADDGAILVRAGGDINGGAISVALPGNPITLVARGTNADINIGSITSLGSNDSIRLLADDDVTATVSGGNLRVQALNNSADGATSVNLSTQVRTLSVDAGLASSNVINRGDITVREADALVLSRVSAARGRVSVNAGGNLIATNVQAAGVSGDDVIQLTASGAGADLSTARVVVRNNLGGVVLRANDDITDSNVNDFQRVIADSVTYIAGNSVQDAFNGIIGQSFAGTISARVTGTNQAGVFLNNNGNTVLTESSLFRGQFSLTNRTGTLLVEDVSLLNDGRFNGQIFLRTQGAGGDVLVDNIDAGSLGLITIDSADDIFDTNTRDDLFARGRFLSATSRNNRVDSFDGIILNVDVDQFVDDARRGGETFITQRS